MRWWLTALLLCSLGGVARADEGDREIARKHYELGLLLFERGKYGDALRELEAAKSALDRPEFDYNIGLCLAKLERPKDAAEALQRFVDARPDDPETPHIRQRIIELRAQIAPEPPPQPVEHPPLPPVPPPAPVSEPVPPGVTALPDKNLAPPPRVSGASFIHSPQGVATVVFGSLTAVTLIAWGTTGGLALADHNLYQTGCNANLCDHAEWQASHRLAITSDVLLAVSVAAAVTTVVLAATRPRAARPMANRLGNSLSVRW